MDYRGAIVNWNDDRGFGFVRPAGGGTELFFHISDYRGAGRPASGDSVKFEIGKGRDGKPVALSVRPAFAKAAPPPPNPGKHFDRDSNRVWLGALLIGLAFAVAIIDHAPIGFTMLYLAMGFAAFALYAMDKRSARSGGWRVPETSLHLLDLAFGIAGGLIAQHILRHKTSKREFALVSYAIALAHIALMVSLLLGLDVIGDTIGLLLA